MLFIGIDIGTTNSKVGIVDAHGRMVTLKSRPTVSHVHKEGFSYYEPEEIWGHIANMLQEVTSEVDASQITSIGITSMAESGVILHQVTGQPQSFFMPWFDTCSEEQSDRIATGSDALERFTKTGLKISFKMGLSKILWIRDRDPEALKDGKWVSVSGYIAYRLTGVMACDYTLATRTFAFDMEKKAWDTDFIRHFGIDPDVFPQVVPSGTPLGSVTAVGQALGLPPHVSVAIAGHDHVSAALAVGAIAPGDVYNSMGTAETLVGIVREQKLGEQEYQSGLGYGIHVVPGCYFWMGGNSASGGSVEWIRDIVGRDTLNYDTVKQEVESCEPGPTGILYYPYLAGCGAPTPDTHARASFIGLAKNHKRPQLLKAILEGTAYQQEYIRRRAEEITRQPIHHVRVIGGGARLEAWLRIKAAISGVEFLLPNIDEAALLGAAMVAAIGAQHYANASEAVSAVQQEGQLRRISYEEQEHEAYQQFFHHKFVPIQAQLRNWRT
ncbi:carbohydrate kinase [Paenibacillus selenitireducens]|uniref:Carbohydrate kinase n=1 Tax=Paenibacillus selenitireducens TaxID=1324314 RepID=A0A1T2X0N5_9BACL|nr:FGGY family carbohydrate kinase [Paenibacillus selenitireducens]OPA73412.1 carbohydrate kinase [Paenibacillus selenitireducens]